MQWLNKTNGTNCQNKKTKGENKGKTIIITIIYKNNNSNNNNKKEA